MTSATAPSLTLVTSSPDHPNARTLAGQLDGELANIYGGPHTGRDTAVPTDLAAPHGVALALADHGRLPAPAVVSRWDCILLLS
ncbi:MAG: hypothetical protein ACRDRX_13350 [Pseudonocardiaceae bacterium]